MGIPRRAMHASCESPWHSLAKHCILDTCFLLTVPFRGMLLTPQGGPRCLAPTAHQIPVYLMVFSTFLCRAFTAHYLYTQRSCDIPTRRFHGALRRRPACHAASARLPAIAGDHGGPAPTPPAQAAPRGQVGTGRQAVAAACGPRQARDSHRPRVVQPRWCTTVPRLGRTGPRAKTGH